MRLLLAILLISNVALAEDCIFCDLPQGTQLPQADSYHMNKLADALTDRAKTEDALLTQEWVSRSFPHLNKAPLPSINANLANILAQQSQNRSLEALILSNINK